METRAIKAWARLQLQHPGFGAGQFLHQGRVFLFRFLLWAGVRKKDYFIVAILYFFLVSFRQKKESPIRFSSEKRKDICETHCKSCWTARFFSDVF